MCKKLFPDKYYDSTYHIDFDKLYEEGYRGIIFDIDNTLVPHGFPADERSIELIGHLKELGFKILFLSNNKEPRVKMFNDAVDCMYIYKANKPSKRGYVIAMEMMETSPLNTLCVGDQLFTDMWGAKGAGLYSILVQKIDPHEEIQIILKRRLEWIILLFYKISCKRKGVAFLEKEG